MLAVDDADGLEGESLHAYLRRGFSQGYPDVTNGGPRRLVTHRHMYTMMHMTDDAITPMPVELWTLFEMHAELCKALASEHRLAILFALGSGERCVGDLAVAARYSDPQGLPAPEDPPGAHARAPAKDGKTVYYSITNLRFIEDCTLIRQALVEQHQAARAIAACRRLARRPAAPAGSPAG